MKKKATIRSNKLRGCPFGLPIAEGCKCVGKAIDRMAPVEAGETEEQQKKIEKANKMVYIYHKDGKKCKYADKVLEEYDKTDCDFSDVGQGVGSTPFAGSPIYTQTFSGVSADGLHAFPLGWLSDNSESRNLFFGLFSFLGEDRGKELVKLAGNEECETIIDNIIHVLKTSKNETEIEEAMGTIENFLEEYKKEYDETRTDTGYLYDLARKWFGPRQIEK